MTCKNCAKKPNTISTTNGIVPIDYENSAMKLSCKDCGSPMEFSKDKDNKTSAICQSCGTKIVLKLPLETINDFPDLRGKVCKGIENRNNESLVFTLDDGRQFAFLHPQNCCESVKIDDIVGDLSDLCDSPLLMAEEVVHKDVNPDETIGHYTAYPESFTWTFYKFATIKGYVTVKWYGSSNGNYSESVRFREIKPDNYYDE